VRREQRKAFKASTQFFSVLFENFAQLDYRNTKQTHQERNQVIVLLYMNKQQNKNSIISMQSGINRNAVVIAKVLQQKQLSVEFQPIHTHMHPISSTHKYREKR
jgi:flagellar basal body rod protein FlgC